VFDGEGLSVFVSTKGVFFVKESCLVCHFKNLAGLNHREDSTNIFSNDPSGSDLLNAAEHVRPEPAVIFRASSLPGITERLAGKSASENVDSSSPFAKICFRDVFITF
jgi:hypothetical protein